MIEFIIFLIICICTGIWWLIEKFCPPNITREKFKPKYKYRIEQRKNGDIYILYRDNDWFATKWRYLTRWEEESEFKFIEEAKQYIDEKLAKERKEFEDCQIVKSIKYP